jgi:alkanesulfonate monooxygenase SsuD/methylene tetrahydromethanopterin reductase-like flavin-dependent oxidoreductase (luciferase family)
LFQAGASSRGVRFAAAHAEAVFVSGPTPEVVREPVQALRSAAAELGRDPRSIKVFTMVTPIVAETRELAVAKLQEYRQFVSPTGALALFGGWTGVDLAEIGPDEPLRHVETDANRSALASFTKDPSRTWTARELAEEIGIGGRGPVLVGSASDIADELERWVDEADIDGFNIAYVTTPGTFTDFGRLVVPELRRRGRVPHQRERTTLRQHLGGAGPRLAGDHPGTSYRRARLPG